MPDVAVDRRLFLAAAGAAACAAMLTSSSLAAQVAATSSDTPVELGGAASLKAHAARANRLFGFAVNTAEQRTNPAYRALLQQQCSIVVAENAMKWKPLRPTAETFRFDEADLFVDFATSSGI